VQYPFKIYASSAGSGKTYTLTKEYLKLALQTDNTAYFKQILAITFTNDAANEMKERILSALKGFADEAALPENKRAANVLLLQTVVEELNLHSGHEKVTASILRKRAAKVFRNIIHDYSDFAVSTIDSFVNRLVSAFTEELNIPFNYEVDMEAAELLDNAVDRLLERVGEEEETLLSELMEGYALEKAEDGKSWNNLSGDLANFGLHLLNEKVFKAVNKLQTLTLKDFKEINKQLIESKELLKGQVASLADEALELIASNGLDNKSFVGGMNGIFGYFDKINADVESRIIWEPTDAFKNGIENADWAPKAIKEPQRKVVNAISKTLLTYYKTIEKLKGEYMLMQAIGRHFYKLSVIHEINKEVAQIKQEKNVVHISDFNKAIINIVLQEPVPFIYERLGEKYNHILIDEFQDTSVLQWNNLLPLVENSVAKGHFNMLVGDAKQAIYGWRGGEMEQIVFLTQKRFRELVARHEQAELLKLRYETFEHSLLAEQLNTNYRSAREIITFNNELFRLLVELYKEERSLLADVYDAYFEQQTPANPKTGGHVEVRFIERIEEGILPLTVSALSPYQRFTLEAIWNIIQDALAAGYEYRDIAILNRSNTSGKLIANFLKENNIEVISQDSLVLQSAPSIQLIIALFRVICLPDHVLYRYEALHLFHTYILQTLPDATIDEVKKVLENASLEPFYEYLSAKGYALEPYKLQQAGIYELAEKLIQLLQLFDKPRQQPYLFRFLDVVLEFSIKQSNHLADFMEYWERKKESISINTPKDWQAVTVSSIHKSKGLEYPVVIVPFADWEFSHNKNDLLWLSLENDQLDHNTLQLQSIPISMATVSPVKELGRTPLKGQFEKEFEKVFIESLNTLYVALTRAADRLYLLAKKDDFERKTEKGRVTVSYLLYQYLKHTGVWETEKDAYTICEGKPNERKGKEEVEDEDFLLNQIISTDWQEKARLSRKASTVFDLENFDQKKDLPNLLSYALCQLRYADELEKMLTTLTEEGLLENAEAALFIPKLQALLQNELLQPLFSRKAMLISTKDIICKRALNLQVPDRVVLLQATMYIIKFTSCPPEEKDKRLLNRYARFLHEMGYIAVEKLIVCTDGGSVERWV
jgi:ATP-dependent exoDNAse (exonuclease V) beta subunit